MALRLTSWGNNKYTVLKFNFSYPACFFSRQRQKKTLLENPSRYGPLTNLPDYSFVDGKPTPLSYNKFRKIQFQESCCKRIKELSHELDVGLATWYENQEKIQQHKKEILNLKLKPKGAALLQNRKN